MAVDERRIAVLGAGKIGEALIIGLLSSGWRDPSELSASARREERVEELRATHGVAATLSNAEAAAGAGLVVICAGAHADEEHLQLAAEALRHLGAVVRVSEPLMDAVTAVSGSGPAYFALLAEAMIEAGILLGLAREISTQLVVQTMLGTAKQLRDDKIHPVELREMVTSPGGTTIAAIRELEQAGVRAAFLNAIQAAMDRSRELGGIGEQPF